MREAVGNTTEDAHELGDQAVRRHVICGKLLRNCTNDKRRLGNECLIV